MKKIILTFCTVAMYPLLYHGFQQSEFSTDFINLIFYLGGASMVIVYIIIEEICEELDL